MLTGNFHALLNKENGRFDSRWNTIVSEAYYGYSQNGT